VSRICASADLDTTDSAADAGVLPDFGGVPARFQWWSNPHGIVRERKRSPDAIWRDRSRIWAPADLATTDSAVDDGVFPGFWFFWGAGTPPKPGKSGVIMSHKVVDNCYHVTLQTYCGGFAFLERKFRKSRENYQRIIFPLISTPSKWKRPVYFRYFFKKLQ
jgi:hypothetical protein